MNRVAAAMIVAIVMLALAGVAQAADDARELMAQVLGRDAWRDLQGAMTLTLTSQNGQRKLRQVRVWSKKNLRGEMRMLMRFESPADVRGTGLLVIEHAASEDDRRLFMPSLRRVQRIGASGSGGHFMASDFTYYDIGRPKLEDWHYRRAGEKTLNGQPCSVVVASAASEQVRDDTGYSRIEWCVDARRALILGAEYYDTAGDHLKTLRIEKIDEVGGVPFATHLVMASARTGHVSELKFEDLQTDRGIGDEMFTERSLLRWAQ